jgi:hypothetical protein
MEVKRKILTFTRRHNRKDLGTFRLKPNVIELLHHWSALVARILGRAAPPAPNPPKPLLGVHNPAKKATVCPNWTTIRPRCFRDGATIMEPLATGAYGGANVHVQARSRSSRLIACRRGGDRRGGRRHRVRGPRGSPRESSRRGSIQLGLRARALAVRMPMAGTAGEADLHSWSAAGLTHRPENSPPSPVVHPK